MRLFGYYVAHTFVNQVRKLLHTWVAILLAVCVVLGVAAGLTASLLDDEETPTGDLPAVEQIEPEEEEEPFTLPGGMTPADLVELIAGGIVLAVLLFEAFGADKSGSAIFLPADVDLLFPSPRKPQSVLLFRLMTRIGLVALFSLYMLALQLPNLAHNLGLDWLTIAGIAVGWIFTLAFGKLLQMLLYTACATRPRLMARLRPALYGLIVLLAGGFAAYWQATGGANVLVAAHRFFNAPVSRFVPVWGWLKALPVLVAEHNAAGAAAAAGACLLAGAGLVWLIWHIKADFYEDAMAKTQELAEMRRQVQEGRKLFATRTKERSDTLRRDGLNRGAGANVYFHKAMYNRRRFAHFGVFTKTGEVYLLAAVGVAALLRFALKTDLFLPVPLTLAAFAFYRTLGNPLMQDIQMDSFLLVPENLRAKMFWSLAAGSVNCLLDLLPGMAAAVLMLGADPLAALAWLAFIVTMDYYSTNVGVFIELSIPVSAPKAVKQVVQVLFLYFGLLPDAIVLITGGMMGHLAIAAALAALINLGVGLVFFLLSPGFLLRGRR